MKTMALCALRPLATHVIVVEMTYIGNTHDLEQCGSDACTIVGTTQLYYLGCCGHVGPYARGSCAGVGLIDAQDDGNQNFFGFRYDVS